MKPSESPANIKYEEVQELVSCYQFHVPPKLQALEDIRLNEVPETLAQRKKDGAAFLEKTEVTALVEWKLYYTLNHPKDPVANPYERSKHGTYRPNLLKLVASNTVKDVRETSKSAFATYDEDNDDYAKAITTLAKLKGIGPATASLLLSCYDQQNVPFFSDELFRYLHWEDAKSKGWDRKINYTAKEYKDLFTKTAELRSRLENGEETVVIVSALDIEKAAYVLGKRAKETSSFSKNEDEEENDDALQPPPPKRRKKATPPPIPLGIQRVEECRRKGLNGSPTYDEHGFELDKEFIIKRTGGRPRPLGKKAMERLEQKAEDRRRKGEILGFDDEGDRQDVRDENVWDDLVARDLGMAMHEVGVEEFEEWKRKGHKTKPERFRDLPKEEQDRLMDLTTGIALRKGSKHR